jgi:hypothetical protein
MGVSSLGGASFFCNVVPFLQELALVVCCELVLSSHYGQRSLFAGCSNAMFKVSLGRGTS